MEYSAKLKGYLKGENPLYKHQHEVIASIANDIKKGNKGGVILAPTGIGKTVIMGATIWALNTRSLVLVPRKLLGDQTYEEFTNIIGFSEDEIGIYHSDVNDKIKRESLNKKVLITTPASYMNLVKRGLITPQDFGYVSIDEAHRAKGHRTRTAVADLINSTTVHAWTATDTFIDGSKIGEILFGRTDYTFELPFKEAVQKGYLTPVKNIIIRTGIDASKIGNPNAELSESQQRTLAMRKGRDEIAIKHSYEYVDKETGTKFCEQTSVWYCTGIKHAENVAKKLNEKHGRNYAVVVSGETPKDELHSILEAHKKGKFKAIVNADLLIEGWDNPRVSVAYMLRDTKSPIVTMQTGGRAVRIDKHDADKHAFIVNLVDEGRPNSMVFADVAGGFHIVPQIDDRWDNLRNGKSKNNGKGGRKPFDDKAFDEIEVKDGAVIVTETQFRHFLKHRQEERDALNLPEKTDEWKAKNEFARFMRVNHADEKYSLLWKEAEEEGTVNGVNVRGERLQSHTAQIFCLHVSAAIIFKTALGKNVQMANEDWLDMGKFAKKIGTRRQNKDFIELWEHAKTTGKVLGQKVNIEVRKIGSHYPFCIYADQETVNLFNKALSDNKKTGEWINKSAAIKLLQTSEINSQFNDAWEKLVRTKKIGKVSVKCEVRKNPMPIFCLHISEIEKLREVVCTKQKSDFYKTKGELAEIIGIDTSNLRFNAVWEEALANKGLYKKRIDFQNMRIGKRDYLCIEATAAELFEKRMAELKGNSKVGAPSGKARRESLQITEGKERSNGKGRQS